MESASSSRELKVVMCSVWTQTITAPCCIALMSAECRWERIEEDAARSCGVAPLMMNISTTVPVEQVSSRFGLQPANAHGHLYHLLPRAVGAAQRLARRQR